MLPLDAGAALGAGVPHVCQVVGLAVDVVVELVVGPLYHNAAHTAGALGLLEVLLTDRFVLEEEVGVPQGLITDMTLEEGGEMEVVEGLLTFIQAGW